MNRMIIAVAGLLLASLQPVPAAAYAHANARGGTTSHAPGSDSTTRTNAEGGSETHTYGQGTTATSAYGGTASHKEGSGETTATGAYGGSATHYAGKAPSPPARTAARPITPKGRVPPTQPHPARATTVARTRPITRRRR